MIELDYGHYTITLAGQGQPDQQQRALTPDEIAKLSDAQKLDYARRFDQSKMPAWKDPRV